MNNSYLPAWLYGALPYSYFGCGVLAILVLRNQVGLASGAIMIGISCVVAWLRLRHRSRPGRAAPVTLGRRVLEMSWHTAYETGNRALDDRRRRLFGLCNELIDAVLTRRPKSEVDLMLLDWFESAAACFALEDELLEAAGRPLRGEHKQAHLALLCEADGLLSQYRRGNVAVSELIEFITDAVLTRHVIRESPELAAAGAADGWSDTEKRRRESQDTVLRMIRAEPEAGDPAFLSLAALDSLTPAKALFNSYPHVWQRVCVLAQQPKHLERYLDGLLSEQGRDGMAGFSMPALKEIGDIYTQNLQHLAPVPAAVAR